MTDYSYLRRKPIKLIILECYQSCLTLMCSEDSYGIRSLRNLSRNVTLFLELANILELSENVLYK